MDGVDRCPVFYDHADRSRCAWPSRLELVLGDKGGTFTQAWHLDAATIRPAAGRREAMAERREGRRQGPRVSSRRGGAPQVSLAAGEHTLSRAFTWDSLPSRSRSRGRPGLLALTLRGAAVAAPNRDAQGTVWLQKAATDEEGDALGVVVHRKVSDDIPLRLVTRIELHVSGKSREELLGKALPPGFIPMSLDTPLPARVEPDGRACACRCAPGVFTLEAHGARARGRCTSLTRPAPEGPWKDGDEVWVFEAKNDYRVVTVEGVAVDSIRSRRRSPTRGSALPAYPMAVGATLRFTETRRGDADPPPDQLTLLRSLWLDFDGRGYTVQDAAHGHPEPRVAPHDGAADRARTRRDQRARSVHHAAGDGADADRGRGPAGGPLGHRRQPHGPGDPADIPAVGWAHDFHQVTGSLHLPPGWRSLHASGVDDVPGTWVEHWSLLELFLALMIGIAIGAPLRVRWGGVALAMLFLRCPKTTRRSGRGCSCSRSRGSPGAAVRPVRASPRAPAWPPSSWSRSSPCLSSCNTSARGSNPALANDSPITSESVPADNLEGAGGGSGSGERGDVASAAPGAAPEPVELEAKRRPRLPPRRSPRRRSPPSRPGKRRLWRRGAAGSGAASASDSLDYRQSNAQVYDPAAIVQTGPGLPRWQWTTSRPALERPGRVRAALHLYLLSPPANLPRPCPCGAPLPGALAPHALDGALPSRAGGRRRPRRPSRDARRPSPRPRPGRHARQGDPRRARDPAPRRPPTVPPTARRCRAWRSSCAAASLRIRIEVDASARSAVPLPGAAGDWSPSHVLLDGRYASGLLAPTTACSGSRCRPGATRSSLDGPMPQSRAVPLRCP